MNYLAYFLPRLTVVVEPIQQLTHKKVRWQWQHEHDAAFEKAKELVSQAPLLKYYNPEEDFTVQCDASEKGLGAALMQNEQPIAFASHALTDQETRYAQIEREMLAVVFLLQKFDQYVYDHPSPSRVTSHIQQTTMKCTQEATRDAVVESAVKYDMSIIYKPDPEMCLADILSRAFLPTT